MHRRSLQCFTDTGTTGRVGQCSPGKGNKARAVVAMLLIGKTTFWAEVEGGRILTGSSGHWSDMCLRSLCTGHFPGDHTG